MHPFVRRRSIDRHAAGRPQPAKPRRLSALFATALMLASLVPAGAAAIVPAVVLADGANPTSVTIAGDLDSEIGCSGDWQPDCASAHLTYDANDDVWQRSFALPAGNYEYKAALDDSWGVNYGLHAEQNGANIPLHLGAAATVKFYYDNKTHWITDNVNSVIATAPGDYQSQLGCSGDWDPTCLRSWLQDPDGDGTYTFDTTALVHGNYQAKAAINESWELNYGLGGVQNGDNIPFTVPADHAKVTFSYNATTHILSISAGHGHDNNVEYDGLAHDSRDTLYRVPSGAVTPGTQVTLRLRTFHNDVTSVTVRLYDTAIGSEDRQPMALAARNVDCYDASLTATGSTCDFWQFRYTPHKIGTTYYRFIIHDGSSIAYYADNASRYGGLGRATPTEVDDGFRLNTVSASFPVVGWMQNGVMYQIFADRFRNGDPANDPKPTDPRYDYPAPAGATPAQVQAAADAQVQLRTWAQLPEGSCRDYVAPATPCAESPKGRDYFGGDIKGVDDKLDYLKRLGVTIIYFNPIFESGSNHGYDTRDYLSVSHYFGSNGFFKKFMADAGAKGIQVVLDGVFNHLSSDSPFFDRYHHYTTVGACENTGSPYRSWFVFHDVAPGAGPCVGSDASHSATYDGWAGFDSIPVIVKRDPADQNSPYAPVANYFYRDPAASVAGYWLNHGARGWRFDVMTDPSFPQAYWQELRTVTKGIKPDEILIAEAWHWYDNLPITLGDQADTAMCYRFRNAVLGLLGAVDDKGFAEEDNPNLPPSTFEARMLSIREDYADATYYTFQNLLDSHDTKRVLWSLTPGQENRESKEFNAANVALGKKRESIAALVQMTVPGTPTVYYGDEVSLTGASDPDDRRAFPWKLRADGSYLQDPHDTSYYAAGGDHSTFDWYRKLTAIRAATPVLRNGVLTFLLADDANKTLAYALRRDDHLAIVVINRNETATESITVPTLPYLRDGVSLTDALGAGPVTTASGSFHVSLAPLSAAIFVMASGQDLSGPAASTGLSASANNGVTSTVDLTWSGNADSAMYKVYRSPVQGGGYVTIGTTASTNFVDASVSNGTTYYYIVRGLDSLGNEGDASNEASATPAFPVGYAVLQYPKTITQAITASYTTVYGQVYVQGLTDSAGDPSAILAQVGYGATGSDPAGWVTWQPMSFNPGHSGDNNYEYQGGLRADAPGTYDYLVRFSLDGGLTWVYGDQDGFYPGEPGTDDPGVLTLTPSSDTTAPTAPVATIDFSASNLTVSWTAATDSDDSIAEYRVYRGTSSGGEASIPIATVSGSTLAYSDDSVSSGQTYYYVVRAFDTSLNASDASNEVFHEVVAKVVAVTFRVKVPTWTPAGDTVYISGQAQGVNPDPLCGYCGGGTPGTAMAETAPGSHIWEITLGLPDGTPIQYKYTRGTYDYVEEWGTIRGFTNRVATVAANSPTDLTQLFDDTSDSIADDNHKAVQNWRDAIVTTTTPDNGSTVTAPSAITVTFNWDVKSDGSDLSNAIAVSNGGGTVSGTISHDAAAQSLTFTPAVPFASGTYTVTVDHVVSLTVQSDGIKIRTPYVFTFTVG